ncbi:hypothetical protein C0J52_06577 [Blattella germanica]|nr:hypothetical protein C0J52_06577 [Blattella germanica]PSN47376.1 hypothetical protein C0J52_06577 [Blattella germanica]
MTELKFTLDILATIPFEIGVVLMGGVKELYVVSSTLSLNRLLKLWKLEMMFVELENSLHMNITFIRIFKYSIYLIFSIYYGAALLYGIPCYRQVLVLFNICLRQRF